MVVTDTIVIGAGQAGLAVSRCLHDREVDHVVLERGRLAERWRSERWDSLRLLTPNWMTRLPGRVYDGPDLHGFMAPGEVVELLARYAQSFDAPVREDVSVQSVTFDGERFEVVTTDRTWHAANVVVATGWCDRPAIPPVADHLPADVHQHAPASYRNPAHLPAGGVLVVGASATGIQLAHELNSSGRDVVLAVGRHTRLPRRYRGIDIFWWLERIGKLDETIDQVADARRVRGEPSLQLSGGDATRSLDLSTVGDAGVCLTGRVAGIDGHVITLAVDLGVTLATAETRMLRLLAAIDDHVAATGLTTEVLPPERPRAVAATVVPDRLDLRAAGITNVIWATGHRRAYPWLHVPVLDAAGEIVQRRGVTAVPGLYVLGQRFQHFRNSNFIDGVGRDADYVADCITGRVTGRIAAAAAHR